MLFAKKQSRLDGIDKAAVFGMFCTIDFDDVLHKSRHIRCDITHDTVPRPSERKCRLEFGRYWCRIATFCLTATGAICTLAVLPRCRGFF